MNDVSHIMKLVSECDDLPRRNGLKVRVDYDFNACKAYVFVPQHIYSTGNGHERYFSYGFIDKLSQLSDKHAISYRIGLTDSLEFHVQIFV